MEILFKKIAGFSEISITKRSKTIYYDLDTINEAKTQEGSIAFGAWPNAMNESGITVLTLDGLHPTDSEYTCTGELSLIYKDINVNFALREFITFLSSPTARQVIVASGGLPEE